MRLLARNKQTFNNLNKIIDLLSDWIAKLEEERLNIMKMSDTVPESTEDNG